MAHMHFYESHGRAELVANTGRCHHNRRQLSLEAPTEEIETEADRQLKHLLEKQLNKNTSLQE